MKKFKLVVLLVLSVVMLIPAFAVGASASSAYQTYTYSIDGKALYIHRANYLIIDKDAL